MPTLDWIGKDKVINHHMDVPYRVLNRVYSYDLSGRHTKDNGSENKIIHGDNLEALKSLLPEYAGRNIISFVDARQLKKEEMVKLPVIVYNRKSQGDVLLTAISLRKRLENEAKRLEDMGGKYIRPIVLFQAEANMNENSTTYEKIKRELVEMGIRYQESGSDVESVSYPLHCDRECIEGGLGLSVCLYFGYHSKSKFRRGCGADHRKNSLAAQYKEK